jgi:hypothetical protein
MAVQAPRVSNWPVKAPQLHANILTQAAGRPTPSRSGTAPSKVLQLSHVSCKPYTTLTMHQAASGLAPLQCGEPYYC